MGLRTYLRKFLYLQKFKKKIKNLNFSGNNVLITGGNSGIGFELTKKLLYLNNKVIGVFREKSDNLEKIKNPNLKLIRCDLSKVDDYKNLEENLINKKVEIVFNCAGRLGPTNQEIENFDFKTFNEILMINALSTLKISQILINQKHPLKLIVNISSDGGSIKLNKDGNFYIYRISKTTLNSITKNLSLVLGKKHNVNVIAIDPGNVKSNMNPRGIIETNDCVEMIIDIISKNQDDLNGKFINLLNKEIPW